MSSHRHQHQHDEEQQTCPEGDGDKVHEPRRGTADAPAGGPPPWASGAQGFPPGYGPAHSFPPEFPGPQAAYGAPGMTAEGPHGAWAGPQRHQGGQGYHDEGASHHHRHPGTGPHHAHGGTGHPYYAMHWGQAPYSGYHAPHTPFYPGYGPYPPPGGPWHAAPQGNLSSLMDGVMKGDISGFARWLDMGGSEFWKGVMIGAAVVILATDNPVRTALFSMMKTSEKSEQPK
jgi:hypothetical protein